MASTILVLMIGLGHVTRVDDRRRGMVSDSTLPFPSDEIQGTWFHSEKTRGMLPAPDRAMAGFEAFLKKVWIRSYLCLEACERIFAPERALRSAFVLGHT